MRVSEAIGGVLIDGGVEAFFSLAGSGNFAVLNAMHEAGATFYSSRHECGAVMMADCYARASGNVGVASVHQGPGFSNSLTGLTEAAKARTPLVVLAADIPVGTLWSNFKVDQSSLAATLGAIPERVRGPETAATDTARALRRAQTERRPVVLSIPIDLVEKPCSDGSTEIPYWPPLEAPVPSGASVGAVVDLLASSHRPAIVAGCPRAPRSPGRPGRSRARDERYGARALHRQPLFRRYCRRPLLLARHEAAGGSRRRARLWRFAQPLDRAPWRPVLARSARGAGGSRSG